MIALGLAITVAAWVPVGDWQVEWMLQAGGQPVSLDPRKGEDMWTRFTRTTWADHVPKVWDKPRTHTAAFSVGDGLRRVDRHEDGLELEQGVWKLQGDRLVICMGKPGKPRPTDFTCRPGSDRVLMVYKRLPEKR